MKELSIEEKAKAYDKAIDKIADAVEAGIIEQGLAEWLFPELKESEDERIRDEIVIYIGAKDDISLNTHNRWLAWLEKQGRKMKILQNDISATYEEIRLFYKWLKDHELQCQIEKDDDSAALFASIKSMFIEVFGKWITKEN